MIELSWPSRALSPNGRAHHFKKYRAKKAARAEGYYATKAAKVGISAGELPVLVTLTFHPPTKNKPDEDNAVASMKSYLDGIADALGIDDSAFRLNRPIIADPIKGGLVRVSIEGASE